MTDTSTPAQEPIDRRDQLMEAFSALETPEPTQEAAPPPVERPRGEDGKFISTQTQNPEPETPEAPPIWERPPVSWKKDYHEPWATVDPKIREYVWQREEEMKAGVEPLKSKAQIADAFNRAVEPYLPTIQSLGLDPIRAAGELMATDYKLRTLPVEQKRILIAQLASSYGVNLADVDPSLAPPPLDPNLQALQQDINSLKAQREVEQRAAQDAEDRRLMKEIEDFAPTAELFDDARPLMIQLLQSGMAEGIQDAYEKAIRLDQGLSEKAAQSRQADAEAKQRAEADKRAKAAKANAVSVRSSTPGAPPPVTAKDRRSMLLEQLSGIEGRL